MGTFAFDDLDTLVPAYAATTQKHGRSLGTHDGK
jgi:hypothetical protein